MTAALLAAWLLLAPSGPRLDDAARGQAVRVGWNVQTRSCAAAVNGADLGDPETAPGREALLRALPDRDTRVELRGIDDTPYRCVTAVVDAFEKSGYRALSMGSPSPVKRR